MKRFGENLGMAFQMIDDCLDVVGDETVVGKSLGTDLETGKVTLPLIRLAQTLDDSQQDQLRELLYAPLDVPRREALGAAFDLTPVVNACQEEATGHVQKCLKELAPMPEGVAKQNLDDICTFVINRTY